MQWDMFEPAVYGRFVYKFRNIIGRTDFYIAKKDCNSLQKVGYKRNILRQNTCMVVNPAMVNYWPILSKVSRMSVNALACYIHDLVFLPLKV